MSKPNPAQGSYGDYGDYAHPVFGREEKGAKSRETLSCWESLSFRIVT